MATYNPGDIPSNLQPGDIIQIDFTGAAVNLNLQAGLWQIDLYGAQGGYYNSSYGSGGLGGHTSGKIRFAEQTAVTVRIGGQGSYSTTTSTPAEGGFNGGGTATYYGGSGGGATDIRIGGDSLEDRVMVAGGGGGAQGRASTRYKASGGAGGGVSGGDGEYYNGNSSTTYNGKGGSQTAGGAAGTYSSYPATAGSLGQGGNAGRYSSTTYRGSGGGGGGYYGGGGGAYRYAGGGGGSGYVSDIFTETINEAGIQTGNGAAVLTYIGVPAPTNFRQTSKEAFSIGLAWDAVEDVDGYRLYRDGTLLAVVVSEAYVDATAKPHMSYIYEIESYKGSVNSSKVSLVAETVQKYIYAGVQVDSAGFNQNPVTINQEIKLSVFVKEVEGEYLAEFYLNEIYAGEVN